MNGANLAGGAVAWLSVILTWGYPSAEGIVVPPSKDGLVDERHSLPPYRVMVQHSYNAPEKPDDNHPDKGTDRPYHTDVDMHTLHCPLLYFLSLFATLTGFLPVCKSRNSCFSNSPLAAFTSSKSKPAPSAMRAKSLLSLVRNKRDLARIAEGAGLDLDEVKAANGELLKHEFLLLQTGKNPVRVQKSERK